MNRLAGVLAAAALLLGACATPPTAGPAPDWTSGRLSLRVEAGTDRPAQSLAVAFELRGDGRSGELRLISPLGTRLASARWAPGLALLDGGQGEQSFTDLAALSRQALGEDLPLAALPDWIAGRPWQGAEHRRSDQGFEQLGWQVDTTRQAEGWIEATRAAAPAVRVRVKLDGPA